MLPLILLHSLDKSWDKTIIFKLLFTFSNAFLCNQITDAFSTTWKIMFIVPIHPTIKNNLYKLPTTWWPTFCELQHKQVKGLKWPIDYQSRLTEWFNQLKNEERIPPGTEIYSALLHGIGSHIHQCFNIH